MNTKEQFVKCRVSTGKLVMLNPGWWINYYSYRMDQFTDSCEPKTEQKLDTKDVKVIFEPPKPDILNTFLVLNIKTFTRKPWEGACYTHNILWNFYLLNGEEELMISVEAPWYYDINKLWLMGDEVKKWQKI